MHIHIQHVVRSCLCACWPTVYISSYQQKDQNLLVAYLIHTDFLKQIQDLDTVQRTGEGGGGGGDLTLYMMTISPAIL